MKAFTSFLFLVCFLVTAILLLGNRVYTGDFFFLSPFTDSSLIMPFFGFACLGAGTGVFCILALQQVFAKDPREDEGGEKE